MASSSFPFEALPNEMKFAVLSRLSLPSLLNFRLVSFSCKNLIAAFYRNFTCPVNDTTYASLSQATEVFHTIEVSNLLGQKRLPISSTRGVGRLMFNAKCLHLVGKEIDAEELKKIVRYARFISDLEFEDIGPSVLDAAFFSGRMKFGSVTTLSLMFHYGDIGEQPTLLLDLSRLVHCLPHVYHLKYRWTSSENACQDITTREAYLKLIAYKSITLFSTRLRSLKSLEIDRDLWTTCHMSNFLSLDFLSEHELKQNQKDPPGISGLLAGVNLESLNLAMFKGEGLYEACKLEHALLHSQWPHLKTLTVRNTFPRFLERVKLPTWQGLLPATPAANLTQVTISFSPYANAPLTLSPFSRCKVLKDLTVSFYCDTFHAFLDHQVCRVSELELLPKTLERLKFIPPRDLPDIGFNLVTNSILLSQSCLLLTQNQLEWLAEGNLPQLKYLGCMMVAKGKEFERDKALREIFNRVNESTRRNYFVKNVDLSLFQKLVSLKPLKTLEVNIMDAADASSPLDSVAERISIVHETSGRGLEDYFSFCRENGKLEMKIVLHKYYELTVWKN